MQSSRWLLAANVNILHSQTRPLLFFFGGPTTEHLAPDQRFTYIENDQLPGDDSAALNDEHRVTIGVEPELVFDGFFVGIHDQFITAKCCDHDQQTGFRHVEVSDHGIR